jgi:glucan phosphoethanolaminetransferase (alkaline phosphatase superfamily)
MIDYFEIMDYFLSFYGILINENIALTIFETNLENVYKAISYFLSCE